MALFVAAVADDDTGATDLAGMLTGAGMRVSLLLNSAGDVELDRWAADCDAVIVGTAARSTAAQEAYNRTAAAIRSLQRLQPQRLAIKYCSTFDSTAEGNIGPSIEAALDVTRERFTVALPALPVLGRTTYMGYHFVGKQLLSESPMRHHPLNPMTNSHLPSHLQSQMQRRVGLASWPEVKRGPTALRGTLKGLERDGVAVALLDCLDETDLECIADATADLPLITGSSAWGAVLPQVWRQRDLWTPGNDAEPRRVRGGSGFLILSGSCSRATAEQNDWAKRTGIPTFDLDPVRLAQGLGASEPVTREAAGLLKQGRVCLLTTGQAHRKQAVHAWAQASGFSPTEVGERISNGLAEVGRSIVDQVMPQGLILAGGETSSVLMRVLALGGLRVGRNIEPGVPVCVSLAKPSLGVVLKSGNFGSVDFYGRALAALQALGPDALDTTGDSL